MERNFSEFNKPGESDKSLEYEFGLFLIEVAYWSRIQYVSYVSLIQYIFVTEYG